MSKSKIIRKTYIINIKYSILLSSYITLVKTNVSENYAR